MARRQKRRPGRFLSLLVLVLIILGGVYLWRHLPTRMPTAKVATTTSAQEDLKPQVQRIAEKIRAAQLNKDIDKWLSCYSSSYQHLGQLENRQLELWKNYDIKEVNYRISNVQKAGDNQATADIIWTIQLYNHRNHDFSLMRLSYRITLENGPGGWKILSSKEIAG
jgi:hypothetical protein